MTRHQRACVGCLDYEWYCVCCCCCVRAYVCVCGRVRAKERESAVIVCEMKSFLLKSTTSGSDWTTNESFLCVYRCEEMDNWSIVCGMRDRFHSNDECNVTESKHRKRFNTRAALTQSLKKKAKRITYHQCVVDAVNAIAIAHVNRWYSSCIVAAISYDFSRLAKIIAKARIVINSGMDQINKITTIWKNRENTYGILVAPPHCNAWTHERSPNKENTLQFVESTSRATKYPNKSTRIYSQNFVLYPQLVNRVVRSIYLKPIVWKWNDVGQ